MLYHAAAYCNLCTLQLQHSTGRLGLPPCHRWVLGRKGSVAKGLVPAGLQTKLIVQPLSCQKMMQHTDLILVGSKHLLFMLFSNIVLDAPFPALISPSEIGAAHMPKGSYNTSVLIPKVYDLGSESAGNIFMVVLTAPDIRHTE